MGSEFVTALPLDRTVVPMRIVARVSWIGGWKVVVRLTGPRPGMKVPGSKVR